ncbi:hypothetical protein KVR01_005088 [Diaporthe batatas]|uniref:uncharacterized protein n=1 Tax=Diaporthe batatas TaxID=748121 RepID=UPI001D03ABBF|nr:uncharacterized protein KVR01_005088 [Diaporthe batatas]KAG8164813.1 hypothetical protein KVR01_005088 [Diaporthe batatas]
MSSRKRNLREANIASPHETQEESLIHQLRNSFYFANLYQWICIFGKVVKIDDNLDIEDLETECLKPGSMALQDIGLSMLKHLSSHRGLTHELFDEYTRRQFAAKMPNKKNPFGEGEVTKKFADFDLFKKLRTLWQMTQLIMMKPETIRPNMDEQRVDDQTGWRIEPYGWDRKDREYYVLDDNRMYRLTAAAPPAAPPKKNSQKARAAARAAKRRRLVASADDTSNNGDDDTASVSEINEQNDHVDEDPMGGATWECIAITLDEVRRCIEPFKKTKDPNERILREQIEGHLVPILEKQEESRKRKMIQREKELLSLQKMAHAKRSSRLAGKAEQRRHEEVEREEREKRQAEEAAARKAEEERIKMEKERGHRMMSREQRVRDREARRIQHEEELAQLSEGSKGPEAGRLSERRLKAEIEKNKQALKELEEEEEEWTFDCVCGLHGQVDDGEHSVACERCNVWLHSKCLGIAEEEAERDDFHFICSHCQQTERERKEKQQQQKHPQKIKVKTKEPSSTTSTPGAKLISTTPIPLPQIPGMNSNPHTDVRSKQSPHTGGAQLNGVSLPSASASTIAKPPEPSPQKHSSPPADSATAAQTSSTALPQPPWALPARKLSLNGVAHNPFSSPHPSLLPPDQSPNKSRAYGSIFNSSSPAAQKELDTDLSLGDRPVLHPTANGAVPSSGTPSKGTKELLTASPQKPSQTPLSSASNSKVLDQVLSSPTSMTTPRLSPSRPEDSDPLPPSRGGLSPTKNSPSLSAVKSSPANARLPPVESLSPSPQQVDLTPPVKHDGERSRPVSQHGTGAS